MSLFRNSLLIASITLGAFSVFYFSKIRKDRSNMKICFNSPWKNLHPGTQNTMIGGMLISQQFESLIKVDSNGNIAPSVAKSWEISDDFTAIKFKLDENKRFSNGKRITTDDVFNSWINSFNMGKSGPNNSLKDVFYNIVGFEEGALVEKIPGLKKISTSEFEIQFKSPFRMAIYHLRGARFAIYQNINDTLVGSGRFKFDINNTSDELKIQDLKNQKEITAVFLKTQDAISAVKSGHCDILYAPYGGPVSLNESISNLGHIVSDDAVHLSMFLNTKDGIFKDVSMRRALQYLIHHQGNAELFLESPYFSKVDAQIYNTFSQGRLQDDEVRSIIDEGERFVPQLIEKLKKEKIKIFVNDFSIFKVAFEKIGILDFVEEVKGDPKEATLAIYAGNWKHDLTPAFLSVLSFDPDGVYHALGEHGAILNPYIKNVEIFKLLEFGRKITNRDMIDSHYKNVSRVFLKQVPFLHIGYGKNVLYFNRSKIRIAEDSFRNTLDFASFEEI